MTRKGRDEGCNHRFELEKIIPSPVTHRLIATRSSGSRGGRVRRGCLRVDGLSALMISMRRSAGQVSTHRNRVTRRPGHRAWRSGSRARSKGQLWVWPYHGPQSSDGATARAAPHHTTPHHTCRGQDVNRLHPVARSELRLQADTHCSPGGRTDGHHLRQSCPIGRGEGAGEVITHCGSRVALM